MGLLELMLAAWAEESNDKIDTLANHLDHLKSNENSINKHLKALQANNEKKNKVAKKLTVRIESIDTEILGY